MGEWQPIETAPDNGECFLVRETFDYEAFPAYDMACIDGRVLCHWHSLFPYDIEGLVEWMHIPK